VYGTHALTHTAASTHTRARSRAQTRTTISTHARTSGVNDPTSSAIIAALRAGYSMPTGRDTGALVRHDNLLCYLDLTVAEAYMIPGWVTVNTMPTCPASMGQSVGVYNSDSMIVVAGSYAPGLTGLQTMKYTASTDTWVFGTLRSLPESVFCEPSERSHFRP
jgi:hypothetical protein